MKKVMFLISMCVFAFGMGFANTEPDPAQIQDNYAFVVDAVDYDVTVVYQSVNDESSYAVAKNSFDATSVVSKCVCISEKLIVYTNTKVRLVFNKARDKLIQS